MATVTIHEAKTNLSKLIARAEAGEEIIIARGKAVARLGRLFPSEESGYGVDEGKWADLPDGFFFDPLPEELRLWEGDGSDSSEGVTRGEDDCS